MKKFQSILTVSILSILTSFVIYSCEDDDICTDEGEVPRMVVDMYYNIDKEDLHKVIEKTLEFFQ